MQIVIDISPEGKISLNCSEDRPLLVLSVLKQVADVFLAQQAQREAQVKSPLVLPHGPLNGLGR